MESDRVPQVPSKRDLILFEQASEDLLDYFYTGLYGRLQIFGHRLIDRWAKPRADGVVVELSCGNGHYIRYSSNNYHS